MEKELYTQGEVNQIFSHIPSSTILYWAKTRVLHWSGQTRDGRGMHRLYSKDDVYIVGLIEELVSLNFPLPFIVDQVVWKYFWRFERTKNVSPEMAERMAITKETKSLSALALKNASLMIRKTQGGRAHKHLETGITEAPEDLFREISDIVTTVVRLAEVIRKVDSYISEVG